MKYRIIFDDDIEFNEYEAINKGYRNDVTVLIGNKAFRLYFVSFIRLSQDYESELKSCGYYINEPNTIIVEDTSKQGIENTISTLMKSDFFDRLGYKIIQ